MLAQMMKSKTMLFSLALAILGTLQASIGIFTAYLTPQAMGVVTMIIGMAVAVLRVLTTSSLGDK